MQYREVGYIDQANALAAEGWRLHTVQFVDAGDGVGWSYVLERERPDSEAASDVTCHLCQPHTTHPAGQIAEHLVVEHGIGLQAVADAPVIDRTGGLAPGDDEPPDDGV
jgi:hypothetical protein